MKSPSATEGKQAIVTCEVDSHPVADVTWYHNNILLRDIGQLVTLDACVSSEQGKFFTVMGNGERKLGEKKHELVICKASWKMNRGVFRCSAKNQLGSQDQSIKLDVYGKLKSFLRNIHEATQ